MGILILILKIVGFLLAFLLLVCAALVLVPVRYRVDIKVQEEIEGRAIFHWLFHLVDVRIYYKEKKNTFQMRVFGISLIREKKGEGRQESGEGIKRRKKDKNSSDKLEGGGRSGQGQPDAKEESALLAEAPAQEEGTQEKEAQEAASLAKGHERKNIKKKKQKGKKGSKGKIKSRIHKLSSKFQNVKHNFRHQEEDGQGEGSGQGAFGKLKRIISEEANKIAFLHAWKELRYLLRHYLPGHISGTVRFSMGSPDQTGKVLGGISLLPFWARNKLVVMPDFQSDTFYAKGILYAAGRVRVLHLLAAGVRLLKDKNIRTFIKNIRE